MEGTVGAVAQREPVGVGALLQREPEGGEPDDLAAVVVVEHQGDALAGPVDRGEAPAGVPQDPENEVPVRSLVL
jgi:hypothetical protein